MDNINQKFDKRNSIDINKSAVNVIEEPTNRSKSLNPRYISSLQQYNIGIPNLALDKAKNAPQRHQSLNHENINNPVKVLNKSQPIGIDRTFAKAQDALNNLENIDKGILNQYQMYKQQANHQQMMQLIHQQHVQQYYQQQQQQQQAYQQQIRQKYSLEEQHKHDQELIKKQADLELKKIKELIGEIRNQKHDQNQRLQKIAQDKAFLSNVLSKVNEKDKKSEQILMKVEVERENLKNLHKFIDIEEEKVKMSAARRNYEFQENPYYDSKLIQKREFSLGQQLRNPYDQIQNTFDLRQTATNRNASSNQFKQMSRVNADQNFFNLQTQKCVDCNMSIATKKDRDQSYDANEDIPVFKVNSVLDWLDYRKHQTVEHQKLIKIKQQRAIAKLDELKKEQEKEDNDWATSKIKKLNKLIKY